MGRLAGPAEWDTPEMIGFLRERIAKANTSGASTNIGFAHYHAQENAK